ncbi:MAG: hypothetical protein ACHQAX_07000 [Gammaproteobacteria bacterium]
MYSFYPVVRPVIAAYQCPPETHLMDAFPDELKTLFDNIPTLLMLDLGRQFTRFYRSVYQHENSMQTRPQIGHQHIHLIVCHDPDTYQHEGLFKFITPEKAIEIIHQYNTNGRLIEDDNHAYIQLEKMTIGNTTINITFLFHGIQSFFVHYRGDVPLLEIKGNRLLFADTQAFINAFGLPPRFENISSPPSSTANQSEQHSDTHDSKTDTDTESTESYPRDINIVDEEQWEQFLKCIVKQKNTTPNATQNLDSFYSVLEIEDVASDDDNKPVQRQRHQRQFTQAKTNPVHHNKPLPKAKPIAVEQPYRPDASLSGDVSKAISSSTKFLWTMASSTFRRVAVDAEKAAASAKRKEMIGLYLKNTHQVYVEQPRPIDNIKADPIEKLLRQYSPSLSLTDLNHNIDCIPLKQKIFDVRNDLIMKSRNAIKPEATRLKVSQSQQDDASTALHILASGFVLALYKHFSAQDRELESTWLFFMGVMFFGLTFVYLLKLEREPARIKIDADVLVNTLVKSLALVEVSKNNNDAETLFFTITLSLLLRKEIHAAGITFRRENQHAAFNDFMTNFTGLITERPTSLTSKPLFAMIPVDSLNRMDLTVKTMCCLLLIHKEKLLNMILKNQVPEINIPYMTTEDQIALMKLNIEELQNIVTPELNIVGRKLRYDECNKIFNLFDNIMLIYVLRNDPNNDPFFETFKNDYADLVQYADAKIDAYIKKENDEADWLLDTTTIHQTPVKSKLVSAAWMEKRPVAVEAMKKMVGVGEPRMTVKPKC